MSDNALKLVEPALEYEAAFREFYEQMHAENPHVPGLFGFEPNGDFAAYVARVRGWARGDGLPDGFVPATTWWLVDPAGRILGVANLRHALTKHLLHEGGHIGYSVRPSERCKGYATRMCAMILEKCREIGTERALITCDKDNIASARVIQKCGGVLENEVISERTGKIKQRYWIDV